MFEALERGAAVQATRQRIAGRQVTKLLVLALHLGARLRQVGQGLAEFAVAFLEIGDVVEGCERPPRLARRIENR